MQHPKLLVALALFAGFGFSATAQSLTDLQSDGLPRTPEETARIAAVTAPTRDFKRAEKFEDKPGGAASVRARDTRDAFSQPSGNLSNAEVADFNLGNGLFTKIWVSSPASTLASDGLGPLYNARSCQNCHLKDGRGRPPSNDTDGAVSMFLRISIPDPDPGASEIEGYLSTLPDPVYGGQLQDFGTAGQKAEYRLGIRYSERPVALAGGEVVHLRQPTYSAEDLGYGPLAPGAMLSPRVAPQMIGLGLLEEIPAAEILAQADPDDRDGDGISGRPNIVISAQHGVPMLGRFGLKAGQPTVREQSAGAFSGDMGLSTVLHPDVWGDCTSAQTDCRKAPDGRSGSPDGFEVSEQGLDLVTFYSRNLAVPNRRDAADPQVLRGKEIFYQSGCTSCHTPKFVTARMANPSAQSFQLIWPYSDLLLHDMGEGLADHRPEARATGTEWRTAPLWGIGLTETVSDHSFFLHDGRARTLQEAILWHGGEAEAAKDTYAALPAEDRAALIRFLESL